MEYRHVGNSGLVVSAVGLGCNNLGRAHTPTESQEGADRVVRAALDAGITLFDLADLYGRRPGLAEERFARAKRGINRDEFVIVTKFGLPTHETRDARGSYWHRPIVTESHYNLLDRRAEIEVIPAAQRFGLGIFPYFPLANGLLTGKYRNAVAPEGSRLAHSKPDLLRTTDWEQIEAFVGFARERDLTPLEKLDGRDSLLSIVQMPAGIPVATLPPCLTGKL